MKRYLPYKLGLKVTYLSEQQEIEIIDALWARFKKKLQEIIANKIGNQKKDAQGVVELAEILEEIHIKQNQKSYINTICTQICREFKTAGDPHWYYVYDYLEPYPQYKSQSHAERRRKHIQEMEADISPFATSSQLENISVDYNKPLEDLSADEIRERIKRNQKEKEELQDAAEARGIATVHYSSQDTGWNSSFAKKWPKISTVEPPKWTDEEGIAFITDSVNELIQALEEYKKDGVRFWPQFKDQLWAWGNGFRLEAQLWRMLEDDKYSLHWGDWINKEMYRQVHGKHAAAVFEKATTILCSICSKNVEDDPDEYEIMFTDATSPTKWRCKKCLGTESLLRAMTREQIGDRSDFVMQTAWECIKWGPAKLSAMLHYNVWKRPYNTSRKTLLNNELAELA